MASTTILSSLSVGDGDGIRELRLSPGPEGVELRVSEEDAIRLRDWLNELYPPAQGHLGEPVAWMVHRHEDGKRRVQDVYRTQIVADQVCEQIHRKPLRYMEPRYGCTPWIVSGLALIDAAETSVDPQTAK